MQGGKSNVEGRQNGRGFKLVHRDAGLARLHPHPVHLDTEWTAACHFLEEVLMAHW